MLSNCLFLILASAEIDGDGFWLIETVKNDSPIKENKYILECHRKELIGEESAKNILHAIYLNIDNLKKDLINDGYKLDEPPKGISFSLPLVVIENIFDFWFERYKKKLEWDSCLGLLKIKQRYSLKSLINSDAIKGNAKLWAPIIESLHEYRPKVIKKKGNIEPMWK